jgi:C1A family cysteine protease
MGKSDKQTKSNKLVKTLAFLSSIIVIAFSFFLMYLVFSGSYPFTTTGMAIGQSEICGDDICTASENTKCSCAYDCGKCSTANKCTDTDCLTNTDGTLNYSGIDKTTLDKAKSSVSLINEEITKKGGKWKAKVLPTTIIPVPVMANDTYNDTEASLKSQETSQNKNILYMADLTLTYFDLRNVNGTNYITSVKNQKSCGSCWAFAAAGVTEGAMNYNLGRRNLTMPNVDISEQELVDCDATSSGCSGGYGSTALNYIASTGIVNEATYAYKGYDAACPNDVTSVRYKIKAKGPTYDPWTQPTYVKQYLQDYGPMYVRFYVYSDFDSYTSGIYSHTAGYGRGWHLMTLVGYNDTGSYWIVKNSWGTAWGQSGYVYIAYSSTVGTQLTEATGISDTDYDADGIGDRTDSCPTIKGTSTYAGCPGPAGTYCTDGTVVNNCASTKPKYCSNATGTPTTINNCSCGCNANYVCNATDQSCYLLKCSDGTVNASCSTTKPKYCSNGTLINKCGTCGCASGYSCNATNQACYQVCSDGTPYGACSTVNIPYNCNSGTLTQDCVKCGGCWDTTSQFCNTTTKTCQYYKCTDGTNFGSCSTTSPLYCNAGTLINNCGSCYCRSSTYGTYSSCNSANRCLSYLGKTACKDKTLIGSCSTTKPKYCTVDATLVVKCTVCGCNTGYKCNTTTNACVSNSTKGRR